MSLSKWPGEKKWSVGVTIFKQDVRVHAKCDMHWVSNDFGELLLTFLDVEAAVVFVRMSTSTRCLKRCILKSLVYHYL